MATSVAKRGPQEDVRRPCLICLNLFHKDVQVYISKMREHIGAHMLWGDVDTSACGYCGQVDTCSSYLDKGTGKGIMRPVSDCPYFYKFSNKAVHKEDRKTPRCTNAPVLCPCCPEGTYVWKYHMRRHWQDQHPDHLAEFPQEFLLSNEEVDMIKRRVRRKKEASAAGMNRLDSAGSPFGDMLADGDDDAEAGAGGFGAADMDRSSPTLDSSSLTRMQDAACHVSPNTYSASSYGGDNGEIAVLGMGPSTSMAAGQAQSLAANHCHSPAQLNGIAARAMSMDRDGSGSLTLPRLGSSGMAPLHQQSMQQQQHRSAFLEGDSSDPLTVLDELEALLSSDAGLLPNPGVASSFGQQMPLACGYGQGGPAAHRISNSDSAMAMSGARAASCEVPMLPGSSNTLAGAGGELRNSALSRQCLPGSTGGFPYPQAADGNARVAKADMDFGGGLMDGAHRIAHHHHHHHHQRQYQQHPHQHQHQQRFHPHSAGGGMQRHPSLGAFPPGPYSQPYPPSLELRHPRMREFTGAPGPSVGLGHTPAAAPRRRQVPISLDPEFTRCDLDDLDLMDCGPDPHRYQQPQYGNMRPCTEPLGVYYNNAGSRQQHLHQQQQQHALQGQRWPSLDMQLVGQPDMGLLVNDPAAQRGPAAVRSREAAWALHMRRHRKRPATDDVLMMGPALDLELDPDMGLRLDETGMPPPGSFVLSAPGGLRPRNQAQQHAPGPGPGAQAQQQPFPRFAPMRHDAPTHSYHL